MPWKESSVMDERMRFMIRLKGRRKHGIPLPGIRHIEAYGL